MEELIEHAADKNPIGLEDLERGIVEGTVKEVFPTEVDLKVGQQLRFFVDSRGEQTRFVKLFKGSQAEAENEIENAKMLARHSGKISVVSPIGEQRAGEVTTVSYPFIEGTSLQLRLEQLKSSDRIMAVAQAAVDQTAELSLAAEEMDIREYSVSPKFLIEYPFPAEIFNSPIFAEINRAYVPFWVLRKNICLAYPGYSLDRHSRNILLDERDVMHHIDFEVVVKDSPIFDFVKITRNGPENPFPLSKEMWQRALEDPESAFYEISPFSRDQEYQLVEYFGSSRFHDIPPDPEFLIAVYETASAHTHLSYIRKYYRRYLISEGKLRDMAEARLYYHITGFLALSSRLKNIITHSDHPSVANAVTEEQIENLNQLILSMSKKFVNDYVDK